MLTEYHNVLDKIIFYIFVLLYIVKIIFIFHFKISFYKYYHFGFNLFDKNICLVL